MCSCDWVYDPVEWTICQCGHHLPMNCPNCGRLVRPTNREKQIYEWALAEGLRVGRGQTLYEIAEKERIRKLNERIDQRMIDNQSGGE